eukprot:gene19399-19814_t
MRRQVTNGLGASVAMLALSIAGVCAADDAQTAAGAPSSLAPVQVNPRREDTRAKLEHIMREVDGPRVTVTKKSSVSITDQQPAVADDDLRALFIRTPGVLVSGQSGLADIRLSYRGLGTPQVLQDGLPLLDDRIGAPRLDVLTPAQDLAQVQLVRGGASLIYGPGLGASINLVSRRPRLKAPLSVSSEQVGGSNGLYSTYNTVEGSDGRYEFRASLAFATRDGVQANSRASLGDGDVYVGWRPATGQLWFMDLQGRERDAGAPGGLGLAQYNQDRTVASTPHDYDWASRYAVTFGSDLDMAQGWRVESRLQLGYLDVSERRADGSGKAGLSDTVFRSVGLDIRARHSFGRGNALTFGVTADHDQSPLRQWTGASLISEPDDRSGAALDVRRLRQSDHVAVFTETVFRLPRQIHVVPSFRFEQEQVRVRTTDGSGAVTGDTAATRQAPLLGIGVGNDFGRANETYFSVTQGYRPLQFLDIAPAQAALQPGALANPERSLSWEAGVHGTPLRGFFYDASLFWIEVRDRIETLPSPTSPLDVVNLNTGQTRHRGFEGEVSYDWLAGAPGGRRLVSFANVSLLDASFVRSALPGLTGRTPAYAPHVLLKAGLTWRQIDAFSATITVQHIGSRYVQDNNLPLNLPTLAVPAMLPAVDLLDLSADRRLSPHVRLLGGVSNLTDRRYYLFADQTGLRPEQGRTVYLGLAFSL